MGACSCKKVMKNDIFMGENTKTNIIQTQESLQVVQPVSLGSKLKANQNKKNEEDRYLELESNTSKFKNAASLQINSRRNVNQSKVQVYVSQIQSQRPKQHQTDQQDQPQQQRQISIVTISVENPSDINKKQINISHKSQLHQGFIEGEQVGEFQLNSNLRMNATLVQTYNEILPEQQPQIDNITSIIIKEDDNAQVNSQIRNDLSEISNLGRPRMETIQSSIRRTSSKLICKPNSNIKSKDPIMDPPQSYNQVEN